MSVILYLIHVLKKQHLINRINPYRRLTSQRKPINSPKTKPWKKDPLLLEKQPKTIKKLKVLEKDENWNLNGGKSLIKI